MISTLGRPIAVAALLAICFVPPPAAAAVPLRTGASDTSGLALPPASPLLPPDHWAVRAANRAEALGLAPGYLPAQRAVPRAQVAAALREAEGRARAHAPKLASLAAAWWRRFRSEFPEYDGAPGRGGGPALLGGRASLGYSGWSGGLRPATGLFEARTDPVPLADRSEAHTTASVAVSAAPWLALAAAPALSTDGAVLQRWDVVLAGGPLTVAVGEQPVGYGPGLGGGIVLSETPLRRVQLQTRRPVTLPGPLAWLGPASLHLFGSQLGGARHPGDPWFGGLRVALRPHPRLTVGVNRAALFGGDSIRTPTTPRNVARLLVGRHTGDFEDQVVSADARLRLPTERVLPATVYLEWGAEDASGGWWDVPATLVGVFLPALPAAPQVAIGAEWTRFAAHCCGNPPWYAHAAFPGGWANGDAPLGHPLGGEGSEALVYGNADLADSRVRLGGRLFRRDRGTVGFAETIQRAGNLYVPTRAGESWGGFLNAAWRIAGSELELDLFREAGAGWREQRVVAGATLFFGGR